MLKFKVILHNANPDDIKYQVIVEAENEVEAQQLAINLIREKEPDLIVEPHWVWSAFRFPMG